MIKILNLFVQFALLLLVNIALAQSSNKQIEQSIDSLFTDYNIKTPGVAVAVVLKGDIVFSKGYGLANLEYGIPIKPNTVFHIGSVSKQFTSFSIYLLEKQGRISLEDDIRKFIPELPQYGIPIRIKHLLAHTSGLRDLWALHVLAGYKYEDVITTEQVLKLVSMQKELNFDTGTEFGYSNTGYTLLAEAIKRITGQSFAQYVKKNIFDPLGMTNSLVNDNFQNVVKNRAYSYEKISEDYINLELNYSNVGPANLMTTVEDLAKWVNNFHYPKVGDSQLIRAFNEISILENGEPVIWAERTNGNIYHAKGQLHYNYKGLPVISHGGHFAGFRAVLTRFPDSEFAIITLSNDEHYTMIRKVLPIARLYLENEFKEELVENTDENQNNTEEEVIEFSNNLLDYKGIYESEELMTKYEIEVEGEKLIMKHKRLSDITLSEKGKDEFSGVNTFGFDLKFISTSSNIVGLEISNFGAKKVKFIKQK